MGWRKVVLLQNKDSLKTALIQSDSADSVIIIQTGVEELVKLYVVKLEVSVDKNSIHRGAQDHLRIFSRCNSMHCSKKDLNSD